MGKAAKGAGGKSPWSKIASGKGSNPTGGEKAPFGKGKATAKKGASKSKMMKGSKKGK